MSSSTELTWNPAARLSEVQKNQLADYERLVVEMNQQVNLISRADEAHVHLHHVVHSLSLAYKRFPDDSTVVDWGTGGGLPGIPLAIRFPKVSFHLVDATRKKILAVRTIIRRLGLENVSAVHSRAENWNGTTDYAVSRAAASLEMLWKWYARCRSGRKLNPPEEEWAPGMLCLKGGNLSGEIDDLRREAPDVEVDLIPLQPLLGDSFFHSKAIILLR